MSHQLFSLQFTSQNSPYYPPLKKNYSPSLFKLFIIWLLLFAQNIALSAQKVDHRRLRHENAAKTNFTTSVQKWSECSCGNEDGIQYSIEVICRDIVTQAQVGIENCNDVMVARAENNWNGEKSTYVNKLSSLNTIETFRSCKNYSCLESDQNLTMWKTESWSVCLAGRKKRRVSCVNKKGQEQPDESCPHSPKPVSDVTCSTPVSDCIVSPFIWTNCTPCKEDEYQMGSRTILRPPLNHGAECPRDLHRVRKCPQPGPMCYNRWTPCFNFSTESEDQKSYRNLGIGYQLQLVDTRQNGLEVDKRDCSEKLLTDVRLCYLNMTQSVLCSNLDNSDSHLGNCVKCWKYRWRYSVYEPPINLLNGKLASPTNCGPYEYRRNAICECLENSEKIKWSIQPNILCENALGPAESLIRTGHTECSNKSVECRYTDWSVWSDCLTLQKTTSKSANFNGLSFRSRDLLPRLNEDYDDSSGLRNEKLLCHSRGAVTQARSCWPASFSVTETVFINSTFKEGGSLREKPQCGDKIITCYANITKSKFISFQFQEKQEYHFCEEKPVPCGGQCVLSEWSAWSDWWALPIAAYNFITETRQRRRERRVLSFGNVHVDDDGEHFLCESLKIPFINKYKAESKLHQSETMIFRKTNFELMPFPVSDCSPLPTNLSEVQLPGGEEMQYKWLEGLRTMQYDWVVTIGKGKNSRTFEEKRLIEMFQLKRASRQEQCFTMKSHDCVTTDWSQWVITGGGLSRLRKVITPPWGWGKSCGPLEQKNWEVFSWSQSEMSDTCSELLLQDCVLCKNSYSGKQPKARVNVPSLECRKKTDDDRPGELVDSIYCRGLELPNITHFCQMGRRNGSGSDITDNHQYSTINIGLWEYQGLNETQHRINSLITEVKLNREIDWYTFALWEPWSLCKACEVQPGAQYHSGYRYRYRKGVEPFPSDFCKLLLILGDVEEEKKKKYLLGYKMGVHFEIKYCLFQRSPIFWPVPDIEYFAKNLHSWGSEDSLCGTGNFIQTYSQPNIKTCFWKPETHETFFTEVVTLRHQCSDWMGDIRNAAQMICNDRDDITWPTSLYIPFQYQPNITFDAVLTSKHTRFNTTWSEWSGCVDLTYQLCGKGRQYRTRSNFNAYHSPDPTSPLTSKHVPRSQFIGARDCVKECPTRCSLSPQEEKEESLNEVHPLCWSQLQPAGRQAVKVSASVESADKKEVTKCRVTNWSHYSQCTNEDPSSELFHFRTREPLDPKQFQSAPECKSFREDKPGQTFVDVSTCNETLNGVTVTYTRREGKCYVQEDEKEFVIEPSFFWQKCGPCDEMFETCNKTENSVDAFKLPLGLKFVSLSVSVVSLTVFCFSTFVALKIELMLKNEAYFESQKQKPLMSCFCQDTDVRSAAISCLFGRKTPLGKKNQNRRTGTIPLSTA